jgi:hypothetical protein
LSEGLGYKQDISSGIELEWGIDDNFLGLDVVGVAFGTGEYWYIIRKGYR